MTVRQMLASMDSQEISEWLAYFKLAEKPEIKKTALTDRIKAFFKGRGKKE